ncbi:hypothetical protein [Leifsonia sp. C5G2]|uniref:TolB family protein n=1 Tax=Leifsonia sp. C5G2 TaxID=2735269 RepID=UPI00201C733A|nr:hypothetical protein [Leifsonia sp. C5G2]
MIAARARRRTRSSVVVGMAGAVLAAGTACSAPGGEGAPAAPVPTTTASAGWTLPAGERIVFRSTEKGEGFGKVASVPLASPEDERTLSGISCERVHATREALSCMSLNSTNPVGYRETLYDGSGGELRFWPLPGAPSRTRLSPDSKLAAWTAFVDGESYSGVEFSTQTIVTELRGTYHGPLEAFTFLVDARPYSAADLNVWGVTFAGDGNTFYATAASAGRTWLVRGNLRGRTIVAVREGAECPSLSPDGKRVAYKKKQGTADAARWTLAVYDLASKAETVLPLKGDVDDQTEWLNDHTLLFGLPVAGTEGDYNLYTAPADGSAAEKLFIEHAWSPSVVR